MTAGLSVRFASVIFVDESDTTKKSSTMTDTMGNYQLSVVTSARIQGSVPIRFELEQNYPDPFSSSTAIDYRLTQQSNISIAIYDVLGQKIREFKAGLQTAGAHGIIWDGTNQFGMRVSPGVYFYAVTAGKQTRAKKMLFGSGNDLAGRSFRPVEHVEKNSADEVYQKAGSATFMVQVQNGGSTKPNILFTAYPNLLIQHDTTLNFEVQPGIIVYSLCYQRWDSATVNGVWYQNWDIWLNNLSGSAPRDVTNSTSEDEYNPAWSPDGRYIAFRRDRESIFGSTIANIYLYDTMYDTTRPLLLSDSVESDAPMWTPDGKKIVYDYHVYANSHETHVVELDGANDRKLERKPAFFYPDSFTFVCSDDSGKVYRANLDNCDLECEDELWSSVGGVVVRALNPNTEDILFTRNSDSLRTIERYGMISKKTDVIVTSDSGYLLRGIAWSADYFRLSFIEGGPTDEYLCILDNGMSRRLQRVGANDSAGGYLSFGNYVPRFSPDGEFIAFGHLFVKSGQWIRLVRDLYVVEIATGMAQHIDKGEAYDWNPLKQH